MSVALPTSNQIKARIASVRSKAPHARAIGIHSPGRWTGPSVVHDGDYSYSVHQCDSPLAMRQALREPTPEKTLQVLMTPLNERDLGDDILLRLAKHQLFVINAWQIVRQEFQAAKVDPRLAHFGWIAEALLELRPPEGYPAARGGFLDAETVWPLLLKLSIGLAAESPDLTSLLQWSLKSGAANRLEQCSSALRDGARQWLTEQAGPVAGLMLRSIERLEHADAVAVGLAGGVIFHPGAAGRLEKATGKFEERYLGGETPQPGLMLRWSAAATEVARTLRHTDQKAHRQVLQRADEILAEVQADSFAELSDTSLVGFDQRLSRLGKALVALAQSKAWSQDEEILSLREAAARHDQASRAANRLGRVDMALRLVRWLSEQSRAGYRPQSFADAAVEHLREGGFVDWARLSLRFGDSVSELSASYARLFEEATAARERQSQAFAALLADWTAAGSQGAEVVPVESVLDRIVAPIAAKKPVLLVVVDGMSVAVYRELIADLTRHEWISLCESGRAFNRPVIAAIPSVTEFSRTSLLCGSLKQGAAADEKLGFAEHPALLACSRSSSPPILFHKACLQESEDAALAPEVRKEIASQHRKIVGVVINAVDDQLLKGEQIDTRWSRDTIKALPSLLHEARIARRIVVLTSDHGHVLDCQAQGRAGDGGERWRDGGNLPAPDELLVAGERVLTAGHRIVVPWSERIRYGIKKNGYHGGITPQEMVIPIAVLASTDEFPEGWDEQPVDLPAWWEEPREPAASVPLPTPALKPAEPATPQRRETLFDLEVDRAGLSTEPAETLVTSGVGVVPGWVPRFLACEVFAEQQRLAERAPLDNEVLAKLLANLDQRGGKMTATALARTLGFAALRLPGLLAKAQRLLNVDGYPVLSRDDVSDTVELNRDLLLTQFDLAPESR